MKQDDQWSYVLTHLSQYSVHLFNKDNKLWFCFFFVFYSGIWFLLCNRFYSFIMYNKAIYMYKFCLFFFFYSIFFCFFQVQYCCINNDIVLLFLWDDLQIAKEPRTVYIYYVSHIIIEIFVSFLIKSMFSVSFCWTIRKYIRFIILLGFSFSCLVVY